MNEKISLFIILKRSYICCYFCYISFLAFTHSICIKLFSKTNYMLLRLCHYFLNKDAIVQIRIDRCIIKANDLAYIGG